MGAAMNPIDRVFNRIETGVNTVVDKYLGAAIDINNVAARNQYVNYLHASAGIMKDEAKAKELNAQANDIMNHFNKSNPDPVSNLPTLSGNDYAYFRTMRSDKMMPYNPETKDTTGFFSDENTVQYGRDLFMGRAAIGATGVAGVAAANMFFGDNQ